MVVVKDCILSDSVFDTKFSCDLIKCKGACCIEGDKGAPLEIDEVFILEEYFPVFMKYMTKDGVDAVAEFGTSIEENGDITTTLVNNKLCAFAYYSDNKIINCAIEKAYLNNEIDFIKPLSCHLYPIRITQYPDFEAVNYHKWDICSSACAKGKELNIPLLEFLKVPLIRKFDEDWFNSLINYLKK